MTRAKGEEDVQHLLVPDVGVSWGASRPSPPAKYPQYPLDRRLDDDGGSTHL
jgi:hypothetical protein